MAGLRPQLNPGRPGTGVVIDPSIILDFQGSRGADAEGTVMEPDQVGRVVTEASFENLKDLWAVEQGLRPPDQARAVTIPDALVDTGATLLSLPTRLIARLGLSRITSMRVTSSIGLAEAAFYEAVRLTIQGRSCTMDVMEVPDGVPALIGQCTAWGTNGLAHTLIKGEARPRFVDGTLQPDCDELIWRIEAESWDDACRRYHQLQGWEPYRPPDEDAA